MIWFVVFALATGEVLRTGRCSESDAPLQARDGEGVAAFAFNPAIDDRIHRWDQAASAFVVRDDL